MPRSADRIGHRARLAAALVATTCLVLAATAFAEVGALEYEDCVRDNDSLPGLCVRQEGGLDGAQSVATSPDGRSVYVTSFLDEAIVRFDRNLQTGELTPAGCISDNDTGSPDCAQHVDGLGGAWAVTLSADGESLYVAALLDSAIVRFNRDPASGALSPRGCVDNTGGPDSCAQTAAGLFGANGLAATADGKSLYASAPNDNAIVRFNRDPASGAITPKGCVDDDESLGPTPCSGIAPALDGASSVAVSADGTSLYATATDDDAIARFDRNTTTGVLTAAGCIDDADSVEECAESVSSLDGPRAVTTSPDGNSVYAAVEQDNAIFRFNRTASGAIVPKGCIVDNDNVAQECIDTADGLGGTRALTVSADGKSLYAASEDDDAIVRFNRTAAGELTAKGCTDDADTGAELCPVTAQGLDGASSVAISPDGGSAYSTAIEDDAVASYGRGAAGELTPRGCFDDESGVDACTASTDGLERAQSVVASADGRSVYVAGFDDDTVVRFDRNPATGTLTPAGCVADNDSAVEDCAQTVDGLDGVTALALSADGQSLYAASREDDAIVRFKRDPSSGALTPAGCVDDNDTGVDACAQDADGLDDPTAVAVSPDGKSVYATSFDDDALVRFNRNLTTGSLSPAGCVDDGGTDDCAQTADALRDAFSVAVSPDGKSVYVTSLFEDAIARFARNTTTGALNPAGCIEDNDASFADCAQSADGLDGAGVIALSPNGESLYVAAAFEDAITRFNRSATGALVQKSCVQDNDTGVEACGQATNGLERPLALVVSADGRSVYTATAFDDAIVRFSRAADGQLTPQGCITDTTGGDTCDQIVEEGLRGLTGLALSPDDRTLYVSDGGGAVGGKVLRFSRETP